MGDILDIMNLKEAAAARPSEAAQLVSSLKKAEPVKVRKGKPGAVLFTIDLTLKFILKYVN